MIVEFFIVLIGVITIFFFIFRKSFLSVKLNSRVVSYADKRDCFEKTFVDAETEREICSRVYSVFCSSDSIYKELEEDLRIVFGDDYREVFVIAPGMKDGVVGWANRWAVYLLLSKRGKFTNKLCIHLSEGERAEKELEMCRVIEKNLKAVDGSFALYKKPDIYSPYYFDDPYDAVIIPEYIFEYIAPEKNKEQYSVTNMKAHGPFVKKKRFSKGKVKNIKL